MSFIEVMKAANSRIKQRKSGNTDLINQLIQENTAPTVAGASTAPVGSGSGNTGSTRGSRGTTTGSGNKLISWLEQAGFQGEALRQAYAIARRESGGRPEAYNGNTSTGDQSYGLFQINMLGSLGPSRRKAYNLSSNEELLDPLVNARVAYKMSKGGKDFGPWAVGPNAYRRSSSLDAAYQKYYNEFPSVYRQYRG